MTSEQLTIEQASEVHVDRTALTPAEKWRRACRLNPGLRQAFADAAEQLLDQDRRATANVVAEELRSRCYTVGDVFRFNNDWRRPAAEELRQARPDLARHMRARRSNR